MGSIPYLYEIIQKALSLSSRGAYQCQQNVTIPTYSLLPSIAFSIDPLFPSISIVAWVVKSSVFTQDVELKRSKPQRASILTLTYSL